MAKGIKRDFAVEIECGFSSNGHAPEPEETHRYGSAECACCCESCHYEAMDGGYGYSSEDYRAAQRLIEREVEAGNISPEWIETLHEDGSLLETSARLRGGKAGFDELRYMMDLLRMNGGYVTDEDGMHVHLDAPEFVEDMDAVKRLLRLWQANRDVIHSFVADYRRIENNPLYYGTLGYHACPGWNPELVERALTAQNLYDLPSGRHDLNLSALREHGTVEIRIHQGSLNPDRAIAWVKFGQKLLDRALDPEMEVRSCSSQSEFLSFVGAAQAVRAMLLDPVPVAA